MIRDKRKSAEYFAKYIEYQNARIASKGKKLALPNIDDEKRQRINLSHINFKMDLIFAQYSSGFSSKDISKSLESAIDTAVEMQKVGFEVMLNILALQVILDNSYKIDDIIEKHNNMIESDKLLNCFANYVKTKNFVWKGSFSVDHVFEKLNEVVESDNKENELVKYLETWYVEHEDASWYEVDKNEFDIYVGYWSFESTAIAKILDIKENIISRNEYYPSF